MQLETVCRVSVGDLSLKIGWQIDDMDCSKGAFFRADTTTDAQPLRDIGDLGLGSNFDTEFAGSNHRAGLLAFLSTFLGPVSPTAHLDIILNSLTFGLHCRAKTVLLI